MLGFIASRGLRATLVLLGVSVLVFMLLHLTPGDPVRRLFRELGEGREPPAEVVANLRRVYGLDRPLPVQYLGFLSRVVRGDLGRSIAREQPVGAIIHGEIGFTAELAIVAIALAVVIGIAAGTLAARRRGSWFDTSTMVGAMIGVSIPTFWFGMLLIILFSVRLGIFPVSGQGGARSLVLPAVTLGFGAAASIARLTRSSLVEVLGQDFVRTASAKGVPANLVLTRHALRNALIPTLTLVGLQFGGMLAGAVVTETVFARRGIGTLMVSAVTGKDFPLVQGLVLLSGVIYVGINFLVDILYAVIDPRIRYV